MIDEKQIKESRYVMQNLIKEGLIVKPLEGEKDFFMKKAENAFDTAIALLDITKTPGVKNAIGLNANFEAYTWIINSAYYSMFYAATALLAGFNHKLKIEQGIHKHTYHALVYYFLDNDKKLAKHFLEQYHEAETEASELLQLADSEAKRIVETVKFEIKKRKIFTYEMGMTAKEEKAKTSIVRAREFLTVVKEILL